MTSFRWRCCLAALLVAVAGAAWARDGGPAAGDCDMLCRLQAYMATDHMIALVPADDAKPVVKSRKTAHRATAKTPKTVARKTVPGEAAAPRTAIRNAAPPAPSIAVASPVPPAVPKPAEAARRKGPPSRVVALAQPRVATRPNSAPRATAWQRRTLIPGSAPMVAAQFAPLQQ